MKLLPGTLLGRAALMIAALIILSQVAWFGILRFHFMGPAKNGFVNEVSRTISMAQAALRALPDEQEPSFLDKLAVPNGFRIISADSTHPELEASRGPLQRDLAIGLRKIYGDAVQVKRDPITGNTWVRFPVDADSYWLIMPRDHLIPPPPFPYDLMIWVILGLVISAGGAYLVLFGLNRQLRDVLDAARAIGRGDIPKPLKETGPEEIRDLGRGFNQMTEGLSRLDAERRLMLAGISHDLRTPLTRMRIGAELLANGSDPNLCKGMIHDIEEMDAILMQFLDYARDGSEERPMQDDPNEIVRDICLRYTSTGIDIKTRLGELPRFDFRKLALRRLMVNIIDNAVRYGGDGIEVITACKDAKVNFEVLDRGPGIRAVSPESLVKPFAREDLSRGDQRGAGLGLTIADRIIKIHNGQMQINNRDGGGLSVRIELPV
jgi:two-component system osmolarity sensor histidine kinase EnvZ